MNMTVTLHVPIYKATTVDELPTIYQVFWGCILVCSWFVHVTYDLRCILSHVQSEIKITSLS